MMQKRGLIFGFSFLSITVGILIWLFVQIPTIEENLRENMTASVVKELSNLVKNIEQEILQFTKDESIYQMLKRDTDIRQHLEHDLQILVTPSIKYVYVLYRDERGYFHYMLDASQGEEKAEFNQPFFANNSEWHKAYNSGEKLITLAQQVENLWISYVYPVIKDGKTEAIIMVEFSKEKQFQIIELIKPLEHAFIFVFIFIALVIGIAFFQLFQYFWIKKKSITDPLTKLYNRHYLNELKHKLNLTEYQVMMIDIDYFKKLNDTYGHQLGDIVLQNIATNINENVRSKDILIRYGGEEFLLLFYNPTHDKVMAKKMAERIRLGVQESAMEHLNIIIKPTISIGIEAHTERTKSLDEAIQHADEMLYLAKGRGRNRIEIYHESKLVSQRIKSSKYTITDIKEAIDDNRLVCYFQPIANVHKEIVRYESLARIKAKDGTIIMPGDFLPLITSTNIYADMTKSVIEYSFNFFEDKETDFSINLNFSDLLNDAVVAILHESLQKRPQMTKHLVIELLENEFIEDIQKIQDEIHRLREMGVKFAVDDFGSGYSNFENIFRLQFDYLKIDGELIRNLGKSDHCYNMVESLSIFAKKAKLKVIAEYVENQEVFEYVKHFDIDFFQGYYIGKPLATLVKKHDDT